MNTTSAYVSATASLSHLQQNTTNNYDVYFSLMYQLFSRQQLSLAVSWASPFLRHNKTKPVPQSELFATLKETKLYKRPSSCKILTNPISQKKKSF